MPGVSGFIKGWAFGEVWTGIVGVAGAAEAAAALDCSGETAIFSGTAATVDGGAGVVGVVPVPEVAGAFSEFVAGGVVVGTGVWAGGVVTLVPETVVEAPVVLVGVEVGEGVRVGVGIGVMVGTGVGVTGAKIVTFTVGLLVTTRLLGNSTWTGIV